MRFSKEHVERWHEEGFVILERFFDESEYGPVLQDFEQLYRDEGKHAHAGTPRQLINADDGLPNKSVSFKNIHVLPYPGSAAINLISLHPALIEFACALLDVSEVRLYQAHTWAKFTGQADYDQEFHCDYNNHTMLVPSDAPAHRAVDFVLYLTDVTKGHGALRYVTKPDVIAALGRPVLEIASPEEQAALHQKERAVEVPPGSIVAHGLDTVHRGSNLTVPGGRRFSMTMGFKAAGNEQINFHVWQSTHLRTPNWHCVFNHATPEQLACLGIPRPGDPYWTPRTLKLTKARWPGWDMRPYFAAAQGTRT